MSNSDTCSTCFDNYLHWQNSLMNITDTYAVITMQLSEDITMLPRDIDMTSA